MFETQATVAAQITAFAERAIAEAEALKVYATSLSEMDSAEFKHHMGDKYAGPGFLSQINEEIEKVAHSRPNATWGIQRALVAVFVEAQRESAASQVEEG